MRTLHGPQEYPHRPTHVFPAHFVLTHAHPGRTSRSVTHHSKPSTLNFGGFLVDGLPEKKLQLVGMSILTNPINPWVGMSHTPPLLRRSTSSSINPKPGTSSHGHVLGSSASACAMCDHSGPTPGMHTMPTQLRPHGPMKPRESALIPIATTRLPEVGPAYAWQL
jgi:hypothetical protein